jgi:hypothetical protein
MVVLYSSGVGYFEHAGTVRGNGSTELLFRSDQINDILKSLVLEDLDGGKIGTIAYPSQDPVEKTLKGFQVDITANPSLGDLLNQLRGASVRVTVHAETVEGTILGLEKRRKTLPGQNNQVVDEWMFNILSGTAMRSVWLDEVQKVELAEPELGRELREALSSLAGARNQDKKPVVINFQGNGDRKVRLRYVIETPIWKTSYRLILPQKTSDKSKLQGWAIVENQTDNDWTNVQLSLVSGRPISFIQDLYQPLYIPRPVVQPEVFASLRPQTYEAGMNGPVGTAQEFAAEAMTAAAPEAPSAAGGGVGGGRRALARAEQSMASRKGLRDASGELAEAQQAQQAQQDQLEKQAKEAPEPMDAAKSVASIASAGKVGELFQYTVGNVTLPRQRSAMLPIVSDDVEVERVSIYNAAVLPRNPLNGARLKNTTGKHWLQGPITVLDGSSYAGDAKIDDVPPDQQRLLSYGVDLQMVVDAKSSKQEDSIISGRIVKGILEVSHKHVFTQDYSMENKSDHDKTVVVEHPRRSGWKLTAPAKTDETTEALYRFKDTIKPKATAKLTVVEELTGPQTLALLPCDIGQIEFYRSSGAIAKEVKDALGEAVKRKGAMVDTQREIQQRTVRIGEITAEQGRIRDNMRTVTQNSAYYNRLLTKLNDQETQLEKLRGEIEDYQKALSQQQKDLESYLSSLSVG